MGGVEVGRVACQGIRWVGDRVTPIMSRRVTNVKNSFVLLHIYVFAI